MLHTASSKPQLQPKQHSCAGGRRRCIVPDLPVVCNTRRRSPSNGPTVEPKTTALRKCLAVNPKSYCKLAQNSTRRSLAHCAPHQPLTPQPATALETQASVVPDKSQSLGGCKCPGLLRKKHILSCSPEEPRPSSHKPTWPIAIRQQCPSCDTDRSQMDVYAGSLFISKSRLLKSCGVKIVQV